MVPEDYDQTRGDAGSGDAGSGGPSSGGPSPGGPYRRQPGRDEKQDEKQGEKEQEKQQEKGAGLDEKYRRNPLRFVSFALLIVWLGVTLLLENTNTIPEDDRAWAVFFWGGGVIILAEALVRLAVPRWRSPIISSFIWGAVWLGVGFGLWYGEWEVIGPIVIIAVGLGILVTRLIPRR